MSYIRLNEEDEPELIVDTYATKTEVIRDATRYYHEHFDNDEDYNEDFAVGSFKHALEFWEANGYSINKLQKLNYRNENEKEKPNIILAEETAAIPVETWEKL